MLRLRCEDDVPVQRRVDAPPDPVGDGAGTAPGPARLRNGPTTDGHLGKRVSALES